VQNIRKIFGPQKAAVEMCRQPVPNAASLRRRSAHAQAVAVAANNSQGIGTDRQLRSTTIPPIPDERGGPRTFTSSDISPEHLHTLSDAAQEIVREIEAQHEVAQHNMADHPVSPIKAEESATTREEMDFDNENEPEQETGRVSPLGHEHPNPPASSAAAKSPSPSPSPKPRVSFQEGHEEIPPQKPPRPLSPQQQAENTLIEAFPSIDAKVVKAVLQASGGRVEPAFNALLGMSDPDFKPEEAAPPPQPPRPKQRQPMSQLEADEMYARQLAEQYNSAPRGSQNYYNQREPGRRGPNQQRPRYDEDEERQRNFFDDDLPEIGKNIQQGFVETQKKVNNWINNFRKKIDGNDEEEEDLYSSSRAGTRQNTGQWQGRQNFGPSQSEQLYGIRKSAEAQRRSTEAQRYDADPHELGEEEFKRLELRDDEAPPPQPPRTSSRQKANPDLFKSQPRPPQSGPVDEVDAAERKFSSTGGDPETAKKWQPLTSVAPHPEDDNDPFSLGDDEEEAAAAAKDKGEDVRKEDTERLKEQARNSVSAGTSGEAGKGLQESERSGSMSVRNKEAEELLSGKKD
jgi:hypothetical protein